MDIKDIFLYPQSKLGEIEFPERSFSIKKRCFLRIEKARELFELGCELNNCLNSEKKVKFYCHKILNCELELYIVEKDGFKILAAIQGGQRLVEHHTITPGKGGGLNYIRSHLRSGAQKADSCTLTSRIKKESSWKKYIFSGTKEDLTYKNILYISYIDAGDFRFLICSKPDQINNKFHKVITLKKIKHQSYISDSSLDGADDSLCMYTFSDHLIGCEDINDDPIVTFSVRGVYTK
tara:strand:- start:1514 stop:2221 length:708 start_codon:yes stop_codon:yes gene_type:complete